MSDGNSVLSQEEIDALINGSNVVEDSLNEEDLTAEEKDIFGEIGNIAMGSASTALSTLLDQKVEITTPHISVQKFEDISAEYNRPCVLVKVEYTEGLEGVNLLIINERDAAIISDLMMGGNGEVEEGDYALDEIRLSAVGEAMNQMMGSSATSMSSIIEETVNISPPEAEYLDLDDAIAHKENYFAEDLLVDTSFQIKIGDLVDSNFKLLAPVGFTRQMVNGLISNESDGLMAKDGDEAGDSDRAQAATQARANEMQADTRTPADNPGEQTRETTGSGSERKISQDRESEPLRAVSGKAEREDRPEKRQQEVEVKRAQFPDFSSSKSAPLPHNLELINDVPLQVTVRLGQNQMTIKEILDLGEGSIVELDKLAGEAVDLLVNGKLIARGEVVVIDENFGFRVKNIISQMDRLTSL